MLVDMSPTSIISFKIVSLQTLIECDPSLPSSSASAARWRGVLTLQRRLISSQLNKILFHTTTSSFGGVSERRSFPQVESGMSHMWAPAKFVSKSTVFTSY